MQLAFCVPSVVVLFLILSRHVVACRPSPWGQQTFGILSNNNDQTVLMSDAECGEERQTECCSEYPLNQCSPSAPTPETIKTLYWFSLGDSYSETGFNASGTLPSPHNPLGNPVYPGWTGGGGENWVNYLTTTYNRSLTLTYNLARGGATINSSLVTPGQGVSLEDQVNTFVRKFAHRPPATPWKTWNTLFSIWVGVNDLAYTYNEKSDRDAFSDILLNSYFRLVEQLYQAGARIFLFINVPPVERTPLLLARSLSDREKGRSIIERFNNKLQTRIVWFQANHTDVWAWRWDSNAAFVSILDDPNSYGFQDATSYGDDPNYFWGNAYHPGATAHKIFAKQVNDILDGFPW